jgi:hypothetical protein
MCPWPWSGRCYRGLARMTSPGARRRRAGRQGRGSRTRHRLLLAGGTECTTNHAASPSEAGASDAPGSSGGPQSRLADDAGGDVRAPVACSGPGDCVAASLASTFCCMDKACVFDPPGDCSDASAPPIQASNYDQTCGKDSDCIAIAEGIACNPWLALAGPLRSTWALMVSTSRTLPRHRLRRASQSRAARSRSVPAASAGGAVRRSARA